MTSTIHHTMNKTVKCQKITRNVLQRARFDVIFPFHERKVANNSKTVQFREHYKLRAAAILFLFALPMISQQARSPLFSQLKFDLYFSSRIFCG